MEESNTKVKNFRLPRGTRVKNKTPAPVQITAEQILREAWERQESEPKAPKQKIMDLEELADYRLRKRKSFEDQIKRQRSQLNNWLKYAAWEESQREFERVRSIFERAIDIDYRNPVVWIKYAEFEMKYKFVNHSRNVWDRAIILLPRCDQLWYKYTYMEEILGNFSAARQLFERWMEWQPDFHCWRSYIRFEIRHAEIVRAREIYARLVSCHNSVKGWLSWAKFEEKNGDYEIARQVFQRAFDTFVDFPPNIDKLFIAFAKLEQKAKEFERARAIYKFALDNVPKNQAKELFAMWISFEKQYGEKAGIEEVILSKRRFQYEEELKLNNLNYDIWFDYIWLEESSGDIGRIREIYERAVANVPPSKEKRHWRRYIYLWISYSIFEELTANNIERAKEILETCLKTIPHQSFSFAKVWVHLAHLEIRKQDVQRARQVFGNALGKAKSLKIYDAYIDLEQKLGNIDKCRKLFENALEYCASTCATWIKYAKLERELNEIERARAIYNLSIEQPALDMPELVWKEFIDFEISQAEYDNTRKLYRKLLERSKHVKIWLSFAQFESSLKKNQPKKRLTEEQITQINKQIEEKARSIYREAYEALKGPDLKEERLMLIENWKFFEDEIGDRTQIENVKSLIPRRIKKRRQIETEDPDDEAIFEEYYDYIFADENTAAPNLKLLEIAHAWKRLKSSQN
eukprot:TRINITY_DN413_c0_g1_i1.p1 TRINITY_DN413_c0_g1~~TRINITY_DN413_c0_g1_i1.p1  ORF type:complete len:691 (-),score=316.26 TRINITY_DN413_c0_g1_i1:29-2101(-)